MTRGHRQKSATSVKGGEKIGEGPGACSVTRGDNINGEWQYPSGALNAWLTATAPIGKVADWADSHPLIMFPIAFLAFIDGKEGPLEEDAAVVEESAQAVQHAVVDKVTAAADAIERWLGQGYEPVGGTTSDLALRSQDGTRMIRFDLTNPHGLDPHVNIETWQLRNLYPGDRAWTSLQNLHVYPGQP